MAFFSKLKDRLFKSSAKIDEGLEAIVQDNSAEEAVVVETPAPPQDVVEPEIEVVVAPTVEVVPEPEIEEPAPEPVVETPPVAPVEAAPAPALSPAPEPAPTAKKSGILGRIFGQGESKEVVRRVLDDEMLRTTRRIADFYRYGR